MPAVSQDRNAASSVDNSAIGPSRHDPCECHKLPKILLRESGVPQPPMGPQRGQPPRRIHLDLYPMVFPVSRLVLRCITEHIAIPQLEADLLGNIWEVAGNRIEQPSASLLGRPARTCPASRRRRRDSSWTSACRDVPDPKHDAGYPAYVREAPQPRGNCLEGRRHVQCGSWF